MTCREAATLLPRFFDGELEARQMRAVALHSTRCVVCEGELRELERIQQALCDTVNVAIDTVDFSGFWTSIERRLSPVRETLWERLRAWWGETDHAWLIRVPAYAAAAAIAVLSMLYGARLLEPTLRPRERQIASVDTSALIHSLESDVDSVTVINDPETTVLWVNDEMGSK